MVWRGRTTALQLVTMDAFRAYLQSLSFSNWKPSGMVLHNTASPTLDQWWHGGTSPEQRMKNLKSYYQGLGWSAGPHAFVDGVSMWVMTDFNTKGVHSPSWNGTRLGIEMVGDYDKEDFNSGPGAKVQAMSEGLFGECHTFFGWEPTGTSIKLHKEDPNTDHACPGKKVTKTAFINGVTEYINEGGDHGPQQPFPELSGTVINLVGDDKLNIRASPSSSAPAIGEAENGDVVTVVGETYNGSTKWARLKFGQAEGPDVATYGWVSTKYLQYEVPEGLPPVPEEVVWKTNITATVFGVGSDAQEGAYGGWINGNTRGVALPYKWRGSTSRPTVIVSGPKGEYTTGIVDVGPWNIDDPDYVLHDARPLSEGQFKNHTKAQNGQVPTNDAGIDLTGPVATAVGIKGKGKVKWRFATTPIG